MNLGLLGADVPEEYGGLGLDKISSALITEKMSRAGGFSISHGAMWELAHFRSSYLEMKSKSKNICLHLATGEKIAAYALTEPGSGSDALGAKTTAKLNAEGTHYILNGEKQWITNSGFADVFIVYAKIDGEHFSAFIVERDFPVFQLGQKKRKWGLKVHQHGH